MSHRTTVLEYSSPKVVDGVVKDCKIIGKESKNGYLYRRDALKAARPLYEDTPVFILHGTPPENKRKSRKLFDHFGSLKGIRERQDGDALYGDLHIKQSHPLAASVIESIEDGTAKFGLSHNASCDFNEDQTEVVRITAVNSVDLVDKPATNKDLFEEEDMSREFQDTLLAKLDGIEERIGKIEAKAVNEAEKPKEKPSKKRISAFEKVKEGEGSDEAPKCGNTHDDFLGAVRGFSVVN